MGRHTVALPIHLVGDRTLGFIGRATTVAIVSSPLSLAGMLGGLMMADHAAGPGAE
jgi:hypothetical protein